MSDIATKVANCLREKIGTKHVQLFDCCALVNDRPFLIFDEDNVKIWYAVDYGYCDIIGLSDFQYKELAFILSNEKNFIVEW